MFPRRTAEVHETESHGGFMSTEKAHLAQEFLEVQCLEAGKMFGKGLIHACPVVIVCTRQLLLAAIEDRLQSWMDTYLKFITHSLQQL